MESIFEVYFGEPLGTLYPVLQFLHERQWVAIWDRYFI